MIISYVVELVSSQGCLRVTKRGSSPSDSPCNDDNNDALPANDAVQAIITTYRFYCDCVNITSFIYFDTSCLLAFFIREIVLLFPYTTENQQLNIQFKYICQWE